jgi:ribosomal protein L37E
MGKTIEKICKICGKKMSVNPLQHRKKICASCSYELKKVRIKEKYWTKKDEGSQRAKYWRGRLQVLSNQLKTK